MTDKEQKFFESLRNVFIGAKIEGTGGFINLMKIKSNYYKKIEEYLRRDIEEALKKYPNFREELFDKLYTFFSRYFTESGSIYFNSTPFHNNVYEKVYTNEKDVVLFWKTHMLYYVKTDRIFRSLEVEVDGIKFYFDVSLLEHKKANEKKDLVYELKEVKEDKTIVFNVLYSERGRKTRVDDILKGLRKKGISINEEQLQKAFRVFERQSEVDYFINKNAKAFLQEQFKLWSYQYFWDGASEWTPERVNQLQILKDIAFKIIDFVSQFEDELVKIWNKPKFVRKSNYVITLDRFKSIELIEKVLRHEGIEEQVREWRDLGIVDENFKIDDVIEKVDLGKQLSERYKHLPIDTKYFKDLELEILGQFDDLDKELDGWLIKSENYQALNTILPKFKGRIQTIYIDPPFNTGEDFLYKDKYQDSTWITLMENKLQLARELLNERGSIYVHLDYRANYYGRILLNEILGEENFRNEIIWAYRTGGAPSKEAEFSKKHDTILFYSKSQTLNAIRLKERIYYEKPFFTTLRDENGRYYADVKLRDVLQEEMLIITDEGELIYTNVKPVINVSSESLNFRTQKPEGLIKMLIIATTQPNDLVMDFFLGSGTTTAVAHKLKRKWIGIEMGEHFYTVVLPRMKKVLAYDRSGISKEKDVKEKYNEKNAGGFFKYYELEQYEETLANTVYENHDIFVIGNRSPYEQYIFLKDEKMLRALEIDYENNRVSVDLSKIYRDIDVPETLSNLTGKWIKRITNDEVEFEDGTKVGIKNLDYKLIKPLIFWE